MTTLKVLKTKENKFVISKFMVSRFKHNQIMQICTKTTKSPLSSALEALLAQEVLAQEVLKHHFRPTSQNYHDVSFLSDWSNINAADY